MSDLIVPSEHDAFRQMVLAPDLLDIARRVEHVRRMQGGRRWYDELRPRLRVARKFLVEITDRTLPLVGQAERFLDDVERWVQRPEAPLPRMDRIRELAAATLREGLPPVPRTALDREARCHRLAARPWIGRTVWGCPLGWLPLIERAEEQLRRFGQNGDRLWHTYSMEERWGRLDWTTNLSYPEAHVIQCAVAASEVTCLACGNVGSLHKSEAWHLTLCDAHIFLEEHGPPEAIGKLAYPQRTGA